MTEILNENTENEWRYLVDYFELSEKWQKEARSIHDNYEEIMYIEPLESQNPKEHALDDLSECMRVSDKTLPYHGVITVSNNSAIGVELSSCGTMCRLYYLS